MNRRDLLKGAAAAAVVSALPSVASAAPNVIMAVDPARKGGSKTVFVQGWFTRTFQYPDGQDFQIRSNFWGWEAEIDENGEITLIGREFPDDAEEVVVELHKKPEWVVDNKLFPAKEFSYE